MKKALRAAIVAVLCLAALPAFAAPKQGGYEAGVQLAGWLPTGDMDNVFGLGADILAYYTEHLAAGGRLEAGLSGDSMIALLGEAKYSFSQTGEITPYVGLLIGPAFLTYEGDSDTALKIAGTAGVTSYTDKNWAIFGELQAGILEGDDSESFVGFGVGVLFNL